MERHTPYICHFASSNFKSTIGITVYFANEYRIASTLVLVNSQIIIVVCTSKCSILREREKVQLF